MNPSTAPYLTRAVEIAWRKRVAEDHRKCWARNPALMRRLKKLSDDQLLRLEISVLELEQPSPNRDQQLRHALELQTLRSLPKPPKRGGGVPRLRDPSPRQHCPLHGTTPELAGVGGRDSTALRPTASSPPPAPAAIPAPKSPDNVIFASRFFHNGRVSPRWIGHE